MAAGKRDAMELLLSLSPSFDPGSPAARNLLTAALASGDMTIFQTILERFPPTLEWTANTRRALEAAISHDMREQVRLLLSKHPTPPTREGGMVPLIAYAIASDDAPLFKTLLACGSAHAQEQYPNKVIRLVTAASGLPNTVFWRCARRLAIGSASSAPVHSRRCAPSAAANWRLLMSLFLGIDDAPFIDDA